MALLMLRLGCTAFGGPAAHIALLHDEVVKRRRWISEQEFLDLLGASGLIPGPTSTELCIHLGLTRAGVPGLWLAGICFIGPAALITLAIAWAYVELRQTPALEGLLLGVKPAVAALILAAVLQLARTAMKSAPLVVLAGIVLALYLAGVSEIALLLGAGAAGILLARPWVQSPPPAALVWLGLPAGGTAGAGVAGLAAPGAWDLFLYFLKIGSALFGSGYVLFAFIRQGLVQDLGWLTERQLMDAVAAGQFTPGPLFTTATFVGYVVGRQAGFGGWEGALAATLGIFLPSFLAVWATHGVVRRLRSAPWSAGFMDGLNAGSVALMAGVLIQLAAAALQGWSAWAIFAVAALAVFRFKVNSAWVIVAAAALGLLLLRG
ncbi:MAG: chromate efflux transporter [Armatimonadota bacterium]